MMKTLVKALLLCNVIFGIFAVNLSTSGDSSIGDECQKYNRVAKVDIDVLLCRGARAIRNILINLNKSNDTIVIVRGLEIVPIKDVKEQQRRTTTHEHLLHGSSILEYLSDYLRTHELNIKFSDLLAEESAFRAARDLERNSVNAQEARKKDKEQSTLMIAAIVFAKTFMIMGLTGIGAMALKALGVAMTALMMAGMIGLKSATHQGHESSSVQYVTADAGHHHHRRRRRRSVDRKPSLSLDSWPKMVMNDNTGIGR